MIGLGGLLGVYVILGSVYNMATKQTTGVAALPHTQFCAPPPPSPPPPRPQPSPSARGVGAQGPRRLVW